MATDTPNAIKHEAAAMRAVCIAASAYCDAVDNRHDQRRGFPGWAEANREVGRMMGELFERVSEWRQIAIQPPG